MNTSGNWRNSTFIGLMAWLAGSGVFLVRAQLPPQGLPAVPAPPSEASAAPEIRFAAPIHDFGRVVSGAVLRHDFYFTNTGLGVLEISNVHASCGCTTAGEFTRRVEPGQTGVIPIQLNTAGFQGQVLKHITVSCNDPRQPTVALQLRAQIWNPIELTPRYAVLHANPERLGEAKAIVHIVNREEPPLRLEPPQSSSPHLMAELVERQPGREFDLVITATGQAPAGNVQGVISMETSSTNLPRLSVTALLLMQPVVTVAPPFIQLAPGPLPTPQTLAVAIVNNGTNALQLSEVSVNHTNVTVEVRETNPGRYFDVKLHFPAGFQLEAGQVVALTARTSHPNHRELRVPIVQSRGPVAPPPAIPPTAAQVRQAGTPAVAGPRPPAPALPSPPPQRVPRTNRPPAELPPLPGA